MDLDPAMVERGSAGLYELDRVLDEPAYGEISERDKDSYRKAVRAVFSLLR